MTLARTIRLARLLGAHPVPPPRRRPVKLPRQQPPTGIERDYYEALAVVPRAAAEAFAPYRAEVVQLLRELRAWHGKHDAGNPAIGAGRAAQLGDKARRREAQQASEIGIDLAHAQAQGRRAAALIDKAARAFADRWHPRAMHDVVKHFGKATTAYQREQLDRQVRAALAVPYSAIEKPIRDHVEEWAARNVDLIRTVPNVYFDRLRGDVEEAFKSGTHPETLARTLTERDGMAEDDARRMARDQVGKLYSQVNQARQESLGIEWFTWETMNDERVCDICAPRQGKRFRWDDPPDGCAPGECHPMDRCYGAPVFPDELGS